MGKPNIRNHVIIFDATDDVKKNALNSSKYKIISTHRILPSYTRTMTLCVGEEQSVVINP